MLGDSAVMYITVGEKLFELKTTLGVSRQIEARFKLPLSQLFGRLEQAEIGELVGLLAIAAGKTEDKAFSDAIYENWDYTDLILVVQELVARLMFSGDPARVEEKLSRAAMPEDQKNALRGLLGLTAPQAPLDAGTTGGR